MFLAVWLTMSRAADLQVGPARTHSDMQSALAVAQPGDRLLLDPGAYTAAVVGVDVTILAAEPGTATLLASAEQPALQIEPGAHVQLRGLVLEGQGVGRALQVGAQASVVVEDTTLQGGSSGEWGGCVHLDQADATFRRSTITGCVAPSGGGLYADASTLLLEAVTVSSCQATGGFGGGVGTHGSSLVARGVLFQDNLAFDPIGDPHYQALGGGLFMGSGATLTLQGCTFLGNEAISLGAEAGRGGAVRLWQTEALVEGCTFEGNVSTEYGSALAAASSTLVLSSSALRSNVVDETLEGPSHGGAVFCDELSGCEVTRSWFEGNVAGDGGAVSSIGALTVTTSMFCANEATDDAGAVDVGNAAGAVPVELSGNVFALNRAAAQGGAVVVAGGLQKVHHNHIVGNEGGTAGAVGATTLSVAEGLEVVGNLVAENTSAEGPVLQIEAVPFREDYDWLYQNLPSSAAFVLGAGTGEGEPALLGLVSSCDVSGLQLAADSPLVDASDPAVLDTDGTRADIGAFGGPYGDVSAFLDEDGDGVVSMLDCSEQAAVHPGALEVCNGVDDDCDGLVDAQEQASDAAWLYPDSDGDGAGAGTERTWGCPAEGWASAADDCDDSDPDVTGPVTWYQDADGDGWGDEASAEAGCAPPEGAVLVAGDCDDGDAAVASDCEGEGGPGLPPEEQPTDVVKPPEPDFGFGCATGSLRSSSLPSRPRPSWWLLMLGLAVLYRFQRYTARTLSHSPSASHTDW
jgi:hypothetical protein